MFVGQEISEIDGIEHKPLKLTGESDKVEVRGETYVRKRSICILAC